MITVYIPGLPQKTYEYRRGDAQILHDDKNNAIVIDGGEADLSNKLIAYCRNKKITHVTYILTHWHIDHDAGMKAFLDVSGICVDRIYCPPPGELQGLQEEGVSGDYSRAQRRISQAKSLGKTIIYPPAGRFTDITVGEIKCRIWRRSARKADQNDREVNNTSMQTYFPDLWYLSGGDMIDKQDFLRTKPGPAVVMKGYHHGNGDGADDLRTLKSWGVKLYWYNDWEPKGKAMGSTSFSRWGAGKAVGIIDTVLRTDSDIVMTAGNKRLKVQKGSQTWTFDIPYAGTGVAGWGKGPNGKWYQHADGTYAVGWEQVEGLWYYFGDNGIVQYGWHYDEGLKAWYYLDPTSGVMQKDKAINVNGQWFYLDGYGRMLTGWHDPGDGYKRYLDPTDGNMYVNCELTLDGKTWVFDGYGRASEKAAEASQKPRIIPNEGFKGYNVSRRSEAIQYIVLHYTGAEGTAAQNVQYFNAADRQASADFFVGHAGEICQYNPDILKLYSWHCGGGRQSSAGGSFYGKCTNKNSIGVEMCTRRINGNWTFSELTLDAAAQLVRWLMAEYSVPADRVIRHWDVTGKNCPGVAGWTDPAAEWNKWKARLGAPQAPESDAKPYRVRKSAKDVKSQLGAFNSLENAKALAQKNTGYHVYDANGKEII